MSNRLFSSISAKRPKRNVFDLSHERKLSFNMGDLIPVFLEEVVPGDKFQLSTELFIRLAPMLAPIMHRVNVYTHFFFVPNRLVFDGWQDFITGGVDGLDSTVFPRFDVLDASSMGIFGNGRLSDYLGLPDLSTSDANVYINALPFRAYQLIYNEFYRDQTLQQPVLFSTGSVVSVSDINTICTLRRRCWEKDYFTSALPWPQRGADVMLPLGTEAPVVFDGSHGFASVPNVRRPDGSAIANGPLVTDTGEFMVSSSSGYYSAAYDPQGTLKTDLSEATSSTVNEFRRAMRLQEWLEKNARAGSRYIEQILSHFGVRSSDARLQRPEYLGGGKSPVIVSEVLQTSSTDGTTPQGNMAGHGVAVGNTHGFRKFFEEHGFIIGIMSVLPRTSYYQGLPRKFSKFDKFDYFWPSFAHLGEQPIFNRELSVKHAYPDGTFGYTPRYAEYKFGQNSVHGDFRSSLLFWHMSRNLSDSPNLNGQFVQSDPTHRIFAVEDPTVHKLYCHVYHNCRAIRPMPKFGTPTI
jgi:hypothetical protein